MSLDHDGEAIMNGIVAIREFPGSSSLESSTTKLHKGRLHSLKRQCMLRIENMLAPRSWTQ